MIILKFYINLSIYLFIYFVVCLYSHIYHLVTVTCPLEITDISCSNFCSSSIFVFIKRFILIKRRWHTCKFLYFFQISFNAYKLIYSPVWYFNRFEIYVCSKVQVILQAIHRFIITIRFNNWLNLSHFSFWQESKNFFFLSTKFILHLTGQTKCITKVNFI